MGKETRFEDYLDKANKAGNKDELFQVYAQTIGTHGLDRVLLCLATDHKDIGETAGLGIMHNYPGDWMQHYFEKAYDQIDPVMIYGLKKVESYTWDEIPKNMKLFKKQRDCLEGGREAGLYNGLCTPLRGPNNALAGISLASSHKKDSFDGKIDLITAYSNHFYIAYRRLSQKQNGIQSTENFTLTPKQREVLSWAAMSKTNEEIATILNMSAHTVDWHIKTICEKLGVRGRILAITKAITYGLIHPW